MANEVYANGMELACKAGAGKTICAMPDVCFTPPENPATPPGVPVPYPNTGMASDTTEGSKTVQISGKEIMLKNKSYFKKSTGDEAGCAAKKGVISSKNTGKVYFVKWSMDVKFEGENVDRHLDMTTNNHGSPPNEAVPWPFVDSLALAPGGVCHSDSEKEKEACKDYKPYGDKNPCPEKILGVSAHNLSQKRIHKVHYEKLEQEEKGKCLAARKCRLAPFKADKDGINGCCPGQTGDHVIDDANFVLPNGKYMLNYSHADAPCVCAAGPNNTWGSHGKQHSIKGHFAKCFMSKHKVNSIPYSILKKMSVTATNIVFKSSGCSKVCMEAQLDNYFKNSTKPIVNDSTPLPGKASGRTKSEYAKNLLKEILTSK